MNALSKIIMCIWLICLSATAQALKPANITQEEMSLLPPFCPDTMGFKYGDAYYNTSPNAKKWVAMMGEGFWHMHHYCWAIINYNRAMRINFPRQHRKATLKDARGDFYYVVNNTGPNFILLPEIYTWIGRVNIAMKEPREAEAAFLKARELKPDYWPSYYHHGEFLLSIGKKTEALEIVKAGLQQAPNTKTLLNLYRDLGGKAENIPSPHTQDSQP